MADMEAVNRDRTPWVIVMVHAPPYHTYYHHYKEMECFMHHLEDAFLAYGVDLVLSGHVHAYERTHGMYRCEADMYGVQR
jgi:Icc-related predicted phosphoesterase